MARLPERVLKNVEYLNKTFSSVADFLYYPLSVELEKSADTVPQWIYILVSTVFK